ncbi:vomeronasal type-1 receptor 3-like [Sciurus carolinensis]|uniref:vomeronasal type-1 receptor 3-like n=1 Tax=Sciurus carolinensis TaxID=30640 RepID=UPI001FB31A0D|nr:vomeronasal type-1 receptor 3-like [Sciurus carolinensis]
MASRNLAAGIIFLLQTIVGFMGNIFFLSHYSYLYFTRYRVRCSDVILKHLTVANSLVLLSKGVPQTMAAFGSKHFFSDTGCKVLFYVHRVGRGVCIGSVCLLSIFQAIMVSPMTSRWAELQSQIPKYIGSSNILCWILNLLVNSFIPVFVTGNSNNKNNTKKKELGFCSAIVSNRTTGSLVTALWLAYDVLCVGFMIWANGSMVFILYRHKQRVQHIHSTKCFLRSSPETRVTQKILVLVSTFSAPLFS